MVAKSAAPSPATDPSPSPTRGTTPMLRTASSQPARPGTLARPVVSIVFTEPPPPDPSTSRTSGMRRSCAMRSARSCFSLMFASAEPPRTVKSSPATITGRPSIRPRPKTKLAGVRSVSSPSAPYSATPAIAPISWKLPASSSRSIRSRTVRRPPACCRATFSSPPIRRASASRRRSSSSSGCQSIPRLPPDLAAPPACRPQSYRPPGAARPKLAP